METSFLITCEHGGNRIPAAYRRLFREQRPLLDSHRGYDPGALAMARALAEAFDAPLVTSTISRLLVDLNRSIGHPHLFSAAVRGAPAELRAQIVEQHYRPYRAEVERLVRQSVSRGRRVIHVSSHSFTPELHGKVRRADAGLLYHPGRRGETALCARWKAALAARAPELRVRRNYPYAGKADGLTSHLRLGFPPSAYVGIELEINQDIVLGSGRRWTALRGVVIDSLRAACADQPDEVSMMKIRAGFEMIYDCPQPTPMIFTVNVHFTRVSDLVGRDDLKIDPAVPMKAYRDSLGNWCTRIVAPAGRTRISADVVVNDSGAVDVIVPEAQQLAVPDLPEETLLFLLGSRYCETDRLSDTAWSLFGHAPTGWGRVQAICDYVHNHIVFGYQHARMTRTALEAFHDRTGVCRDYAHLAVALCRCMNIPARYCTGYLGDIGMPPPYGTMDFAAWFEAYLGGQWYTFDARNNIPRIGRVLIARGRDASDVAISSTFGPNTLTGFRVWTDEVVAA